MALVIRGWTGRFFLAGFCLTLSIVAAGLGRGTEEGPPRTPRQATEEEEEEEGAAGSRAPGLWSSWGPWGACSQPCGLGVSERTRSCQSPYPRSPWPRRPDPLAPHALRPPQLPSPEDRARGRHAARPGSPYPARTTYPLQHRGPAPPFSQGASVLPLHSPARLPHGGPPQRHTRHQGLPGEEEPPVAPSQVLGAPHPGGRRGPAPFAQAAPLPRPGPPRPHGSARDALPLFKPPRGDGHPHAGPGPEQAPHGSRADSGRTPEPQAGPRSRVREAIKPGKYGYGKVPFALPLHRDPSEGGPSRSRRHPEDPGGPLPPPPGPPPKKARRKLPRPPPPEEARAPKEMPPSGLEPGGHSKPRPARGAEGGARGPLHMDGGPGASSGQGRPQNADREGAKRGDRAEAPAEEESLPRAASPSGTPARATLHLGHHVLRVPSPSAATREGPGPGGPPEPPPPPESGPPSGHAGPHGPARVRTQRQDEPRGRGGHAPRASHGLFVAPRSPEPGAWQPPLGIPAQPHGRGHGGPREGAEPPQWNLYYPGTETFRCEGESKQLKACRQEPCPADRPDPRAVQCAAYNDQEFMGRFYQWEPFTEVRGSQRCELNCRPIGHRFYVRHTDRVQDGVPCDQTSSSSPQEICVAGQCLTSGCDGILGSNRTRDSCGVCGGDHTTCKLVVGNYSEADVPIGYHRLLEIPAGATRIHVRELAPSPNYLALRSRNGKSIINGNWAVNPPGRYEAAGTVFVYSRPGSDRQEGESLMADGPTLEPVDVYMIFQQDNPGVSYQFFLSVAPPPEQPPSRPDFGALTMVSPGRPPGAPVTRVVGPASTDAQNWIPAGAPVPPLSHPGRGRAVAPPPPPPPAPAPASGRTPGTLQRNVRVPPLPLPPPPPQRHSEGSPSSYYWRRFGNTECSASCGKGFWQSVYRCISRSSQEEVAEEYCHLIPKPIVQEEACNTEPCPAYWEAGDWSACSKSCGVGTQHRQVLCRQTYANRSTVVHPQRCSGHLEKPNATQQCQAQVCSRWEVGADWSPCSVLCGTGHRTRPVRCVSHEGAPLRDADCPGAQRPRSTDPCEMGPCVHAWYHSDWSHTCSAECGTGIQRRSVVCLSSNADGEAEESCAGAKPAEMRACSGGPCQRVTHWYSGPWGTCSSDCGPGSQRRDVICVSKLGADFNVTEASECAHLEKPPGLQPCAGTACKARWFSTAWGPCSRSCVGGVQVRQVQCLTQNKTLSNRCPPALKPAQKQLCNLQPCLPELDENCRDQYHNCPVIVQARLCAYSYYKAVCCASCDHALQRRHAGPSR